MAKFQLQENEKLIGSGSMAYHEIEGKLGETSGMGISTSQTSGLFSECP